MNLLWDLIFRRLFKTDRGQDAYLWLMLALLAFVVVSILIAVGARLLG